MGYAEAVKSGEKRFEVRRNDRGYQRGDTVAFRVVDRDGLPMEHELNNSVFEISYVLSGWGLRDGFVAFGITPAMEW